MKFKLFSILCGILLVLNACGGATNDENAGEDTAQEENNAATDDNQDQAQEEEQDQDGAQKGTIGDTLTIEGVKITLDSVEVYQGTINEFQPLTQDHAIVANLTVENTNKESYFIDSMEFTLYDAEGFELTQALPSDDMAISTELPGGKKVKGTLYFDVPKQEGDWELQYKPMASFDDTAAVWTFPAK